MSRTTKFVYGHLMLYLPLLTATLLESVNKSEVRAGTTFLVVALTVEGVFFIVSAWIEQ